MRFIRFMSFLLMSVFVLTACDSNDKDQPVNIINQPPVIPTGDQSSSGKFVYSISPELASSTTDRWQSYMALQFRAALAPLNNLNGLLEKTSQ